MLWLIKREQQGCPSLCGSVKVLLVGAELNYTWEGIVGDCGGTCYVEV